MKKSRFTEEQIIGILKQHEAGRNLAMAREKIGNWREEYNGELPHSSLAYRTPNDYAAQLRTSAQSG